MIVETQASMLAAIRQTLGNSVKYVEPHPGDWSAQTLQRVIMSAPAVYVAWLGCKDGSRPAQIMNEWVVFIAAQTLNGVRGDAVGTYQITERLMALFGGHVEGVGKLQLTRARNLWSEQQSASGSAIYALYYDGAGVLDPLVPFDSLDDFLQYNQTWAAENTAAPVMAAEVRLPGPGENNE